MNYEIKKFYCNDGNEARARERYWYELLKATLNIQKPNRSHSEYVEENYSDILKRNIVYQQQNKEKLNEIRSAQSICACGSKYTYRNKAQHCKSKKHLDYIKSLEV